MGEVGGSIGDIFAGPAETIAGHIQTAGDLAVHVRQAVTIATEGSNSDYAQTLRDTTTEVVEHLGMAAASLTAAKFAAQNLLTQWGIEAKDPNSLAAAQPTHINTGTHANAAGVPKPPENKEPASPGVAAYHAVRDIVNQRLAGMPAAVRANVSLVSFAYYNGEAVIGSVEVHTLTADKMTVVLRTFNRRTTVSYALSADGRMHLIGGSSDGAIDSVYASPHQPPGKQLGEQLLHNLPFYKDILNDGKTRVTALVELTHPPSDE